MDSVYGGDFQLRASVQAPEVELGDDTMIVAERFRAVERLA
jgi:hypothetical protein